MPGASATRPARYRGRRRTAARRRPAHAEPPCAEASRRGGDQDRGLGALGANRGRTRRDRQLAEEAAAACPTRSARARASRASSRRRAAAAPRRALRRCGPAWTAAPSRATTGRNTASNSRPFTRWKVRRLTPRAPSPPGSYRRRNSTTKADASPSKPAASETRRARSFWRTTSRSPSESGTAAAASRPRAPRRGPRRPPRRCARRSCRAKQARSDEAIAEERRLLYVGMTRAKRVLWLTWSGKRSRFLAELGRRTRGRDRASRGAERLRRRPARSCARGGSSARGPTACRRTSSSTTASCTRSRRRGRRRVGELAQIAGRRPGEARALRRRGASADRALRAAGRASAAGRAAMRVAAARVALVQLERARVGERAQAALADQLFCRRRRAVRRRSCTRERRVPSASRLIVPPADTTRSA